MRILSSLNITDKTCSLQINMGRFLQTFLHEGHLVEGSKVVISDNSKQSGKINNYKQVQTMYP